MIEITDRLNMTELISTSSRMSVGESPALPATSHALYVTPALTPATNTVSSASPEASTAADGGKAPLMFPSVTPVCEATWAIVARTLLAKVYSNSAVSKRAEKVVPLGSAKVKYKSRRVYVNWGERGTTAWDAFWAVVIFARLWTNFYIYF